MKKILTIAGSDCSGGAGIQADLKTIEAHGMYGMSVITALTAQNTVGISGIMPISGEFVKKQLEAVFEDIFPDAVKIGMLPEIEVMKAVVETIKKYQPKNIVLDPVLSSTSGTEFSGNETREYMKNQLFCLCDIITPNIPEAEILNNRRISSRKDMEDTVGLMAEKYGCGVLVKGGHSSFDKEDRCSDCLCVPRHHENEGKFIWLEGRRLDNPNTHGTGCTLSSAIACNLALGKDPEQAVKGAKEYLERCIAAGLDLGKGRGPLLHKVQIN